LGLTFLFATDDDQNTDPILDEQNQTIISLRRGGEYNITSTDDSSTARGFKLLDGTADSEIDAKINIIGNAITLQPTSAAAITLGEYNNVEFNVTASTTSFQGYGSYSISYPGVRVPYSSTFKVSGSTMLTASGGNNQVACAIGGITQDGSSDQLAKSCGTIIFDGNISATLTSGKNSEDGRINGSAVIGGAGCSVSSNKAGDCKGVVINTTGTIVCNQPSGSNFRYGQGPVIGGGGFGKRTNQ
jgi:hypothetical protein